MPDSNYDKLHDKYYSIINDKSGTRYERLAAILFKTIEESDLVIHDIALIGLDTEVPHQIDVKVETPTGPKRILIECKDFDKADKNVDLPIIRNFFAVIDDIKPDLGIVITTRGYSPKAKKYAKAKGIKLAVLRAPTQKDFETRTQTTILNIHLLRAVLKRISLVFHEGNEEKEKQLTELAEAAGINPGLPTIHDPISINFPEGSEQLVQFANAKSTEAATIEKTGAQQIGFKLDGIAPIEILGHGTVPVAGIIIHFDVTVHTETIEQSLASLPELIYTVLDEEASDFIVFEHDLRKLRIDPDSGEVHPI